MEEYTQLKAEKARRCGQEFNWETAMYGKVRYFEDVDYFKNFEAEFPAIVYKDALTSKPEISPEPTNLYASFGIPFNPKQFYKDGVYTRGCEGPYMAPRPPRAKRYHWLRFEGQDYIDVDIQDFKDQLGKIYDRYVHRVHVLDFDILTKEMREAMTNRLRIEHPNAQEQVVFTSHAWRALFGICRPLVQELILELFSTFRIAEGVLDLDAAKTLQFQLGGLRHHMTWRQFILALGLHTDEEMGSDEPGKVTTTSFFYLRSMDEGVSGERPLLANAGLTMVVHDLTMIDMDELVRLHICERLGDVETWVAPKPERQQDHGTKDIEIGGGVHRLRNNFGEQRVVVDTISRDFARFSTWVVGRLRQLLDARDVTYPSFFIIAVQTPGSGISILLAVGTPSTGSGNFNCQ
nr:hypothetical protein [Tanacetum cinerariifolium]